MKVNEYGDMIIFNSTDEYYFKEEAGIKPNTVSMSYDKAEKDILEDFYTSIQNNCRYIEIHNKTSPHRFFKRMIRDISKMLIPFTDDYIYIFSWKE